MMARFDTYPSQAYNLQAYDVKMLCCAFRLVVRHVTIFGHGHGLQRAIIDESQHRKPERLIMAQH